MKQNYPFWIYVIVVAGVLSLLLYQGVLKMNASGVQPGRLRVSASFYPLYYFASVVGGDKAEVSSITPASAEPHDYEPTAQDIARIEDSGMLILNGGNLEAWGDKIKSELQGKNVLVVIAGAGIADKQLTESGRTVIDPHVWLDPVLAKYEVENIKKGFDKADPADAPYFDSNARSLEARLDALNGEYSQGLGSCRLKDIVTSHAAFGYLAARYNLNQVAVAGISPDAEPSPQAVAQVSDLAKSEGIKVIFFESLVNPKLSQAIAAESGAQTMVLDPIEGVPESQQSAGADYFSIMEQNLKNLKIALQCVAK